MTRTICTAAVCALILAGCTEMTDYYEDVDTVDIDGAEFFVTPRPNNGKNVYLAGPNQPKGSQLVQRDFTLPVKSVKAIEAVTGCPVLTETVVNLSAGTTFAAVDCG